VSTWIGRATLYKYFPDVESILVAWHARDFAGHLARLEALSEAPDLSLDDVVTFVAGQRRHHPHGKGSDLFGTLAHTLADAHGAPGPAIEREIVAALAQLVRRLVELKQVRNDHDPDVLRWVRRLLRTWADEGRTVVVSSHQLAEVAQVVDRVVIIRDGTLVNETDVAALTASRVTVRVDRTDLMVTALRSAGVEHELLPDGALCVAGRDTAEIGGIAARAGATVTELSRRSAGETLEAMFLAATRGSGQ
jgi:AcrR family transcriptional regulator